MTRQNSQNYDLLQKIFYALTQYFNKQVLINTKEIVEITRSFIGDIKELLQDKNIPIYASREIFKFLNSLLKEKQNCVLWLKMESKKYKKYAKRTDFVKALTDIYEILYLAENAEKLKQFGRLHYEPLKHQYSGCHSIRIRYDWVERLIVKEADGGITIEMLEINTDHYGNKK